MAHKDIVVVGASTGGIETLQQLAAALPQDFRSSVFVVIHTSATSPNVVDQIVARAGPLPAVYARDGRRIEPGCIYLAPSDRHLVLEPGHRMRLTRGPRENRSRPAVDVLFRTAAHAYGARVVGVVLSGWLDDGTAGLRAIKQRGGTAIVQDPEQAIAPGMARSALAHVDVDFCLPVTDIARTLVELSTTPAREGEGVMPMPELMDTEVKIAKQENALELGLTELASPSMFACPECQGVLFEIKDGDETRFRCHTGHAYSPETLLAEFSDKNEDTLWSAIRSLEETVILLRDMANHLDRHDQNGAAERLRSKAARTLARADLVREAVARGVEINPDPGTDAEVEP